MNRSDLPLVTLDLRHAGELVAHPCICGRDKCTLGEHLWRATHDMAPGIRAQTTEIRVSGTGTPPDPDDAQVDVTGILHTEYKRLLADAHRAARQLADFIERNRPDRGIPTSALVSVGRQWCPNHLRYAALCEPVAEGRDGYCRWCWEIRQVEGSLPDAQLMKARHERGRQTPAMIEDFRQRMKSAKAARNTRARAG